MRVTSIVIGIIVFLWPAWWERTAMAAEFQGLGNSPAGGGSPLGISADGTTIVGSTTPLNDPNSSEAFRWTRETGMQRLGFFPGNAYSVARAVSADGSVVVGQSVDSANVTQAFRWTAQTGMIPLGIPIGRDFSDGIGVSSDGNLILISGGSPPNSSFKWTAQTGFIAVVGYAEAVPSAMSADGSVLVGFNYVNAELLRWTAATGWTDLGISVGACCGETLSISADGAFIVGSTEDSNPRVFRLSAKDGLIDLGPGIGRDISGNGSILVGAANPFGAMIWDSVHGQRGLQNVLANQYGLNLSGWQLLTADAVSDDGGVIAGTGDGPNGLEGYVAVLFPRWITDGGGSWSSSNNWWGGVPNGIGTTMLLAGKLSNANAPATVTLDGDRTVGKMIFDNANSYVVAQGSGGTLLIDNGGNTAEINVLSGQHRIAAPISLVDSTRIDISAGSELILNGPISVAANGTLTKAGSGQLSILNALNLPSYSAVSVEAGNLTISSNLPATIGDAVYVTIKSGASLFIGGTADPLTDATVLNRRVTIVNDGSLTFYEGSKSPYSISGRGATVVGDGSVAVSLSARFIRGASLTIRANSQVVSNGNGAGGGVSRLDHLNIDGTPSNWQGKFDLSNNDLIVQADDATVQATLDTIADQIRSARGSGLNLWRGNGITSSAAANNAKGITGLAAIRNINATGGTIYRMFDEQPVDADSVIVKYTYNGDTDLNGKIDANDYFQIDNGFLQHLTGYRNGDFDYDGVIDADDYFLIDNAFVNQSGVFGGDVESAAAVPEPAGMVIFGVIFVESIGRCLRRRTYYKVSSR